MGKKKGLPIEKEKLKRNTLINSFTRLYDDLENAIESPHREAEVIESLFEQLENKATRIAELDEKILNCLIEESASEITYEEEFNRCETFTEKLINMKVKVKRLLSQSAGTVNSSSTDSVKSTCDSTGSLRLPEIKLTEFDGNPRNWLNFWNSFKKIHEDEKLDAHAKFVYLIQATSPKSKAREIVISFPTTADNYPKVIQHLEKRFGQEEMLIQIYVKDLLQIVLNNNSSKKFCLATLYDNLEAKLRALESLGVTEDKYASILYPLVESCIPQDILRIWERVREKSAVEGKTELYSILEFLRKEVISEERILITRSNFGLDKNKKHSNFNIDNEECKFATANDLMVGVRDKSAKFKEKVPAKKAEEICIFCDNCHPSEKCFKARSLSYETKKSLVFKKGACLICLKRNHVSRACRSNYIKCLICNRRHLEILCDNLPSNRKNAESEHVEVAADGNPAGATSNSRAENVLTSAVSYNELSNSQVLLQTLMVRVSHGNREKIVRAIIDTGSERTYVSEDVIQFLRADKCGEVKLIHKLFGGVETKERLHRKYKIKVSSIDKKYSCDILCLDERVICSDIRQVPYGPWVKELKHKGIKISDLETSSLNVGKEIKLLIGADIAGKLFTSKLVHLDSGSVAVETHLGWTLMGQIEENFNHSNSLAVLSVTLHVSDMRLSDLWRLETIGIADEVNKTKSVLEEETRVHFLESVKRDNSGRYEVTLPWIIDNSILPSNRSMAEKSLYKTESKLVNENKIKEYKAIFDDWETNNIIEVVTDEKRDGVHFLPHRPVIKESSETTKIRPVFNASAHSKNLPSLNDCLAKGPNLIEIIPSIINRFRKYRIGVSSDIEKAFCQIKIAEKDRDFLRFLWFDNQNDLKIYRHNRVVFGLTSSPFLLAATLNHLLSTVPEDVVETSNILKDSFYIDNSLVSLGDVESTEKFIREAKAILASGHFNLRCWRSNMPLGEIGEIENEQKLVLVLGLMWDTQKDTLSCNFDKPVVIEEPITKRKILSATQKVFDPVGFTAPAMLIPKLILQETWIQKTKWDEELPSQLCKQFKKWSNQLSLLSHIAIPRWLNVDYECEGKITLHIFSDASKRAYATCAYLRVEAAEGTKVQLVNARSRVSPIKELTIPRLELLSCLIGARLAKTVISDLKLENCPTVFWSDSTTALGWLRRDQTWGTFVHNRVQEIRLLTQISDWRYVPGSLNPADLPSRGCSFEQLQKSNWWEGPSWLYLSADEWPQNEEEPDEELLNCEKRKTILTLLNKGNKNSDWYYRYFSSYQNLVRMVGWIFRFYYNIRNIRKNLSRSISVEEFEHAERAVFKLIQQETFTGITDPKIRSLRVFIDEHGIIRLKTQVLYRQDTTNFRFPILLPSDHPVVHRLIFWKHNELLHAGVSLLMAHLREDYWIVKARKTIRAVVQQCVKCKRFNAQKLESEPIALPADRVQDAAVFQTVGVDLAGPLYLRGKKKAWIVLFTCAVYRAVHLELVTSLSTEAFLQSLRRFVARRGRPTTVYSDNGSNFIGTDNAFSSIDWDKISASAAVQRIRWKFNPPTAAWWGGWWERLVQLVKRILRKVLGKASLTYEELVTVLCDCEHVVNSRPLTYVSDDVDAFPPLTPSVFLQDIKSSNVGDFDTVDALTLNKRVRHIQTIRDHVRRRFRIEYLGQLRQQTIRQTKIRPFSIGDVVLLETDKKRMFWPMARIMDLIPGKDGISRVARVKTESSEFVRPIQKLYHLEVQKDTVPGLSDPVVTRSGRTIKVPERLTYT